MIAPLIEKCVKGRTEALLPIKTPEHYAIAMTVSCNIYHYARLTFPNDIAYLETVKKRQLATWMCRPVPAR